jgi:trans-2,3-dihydro-3-hydroxyanthranilate isomerase
MGKLTFYIVDVFAEKKFAGNQLAVFRSGVKLSTEQMQAIAREMHFSETTFIISEKKREGGYSVRIFTPASEVPFAGHPTLGTAYILRTEIESNIPDKIILNLPVGQIPVTFLKNIGWMKQVKPEFGASFDADIVADILGLKQNDIDTRFPIEEVSTGLPHIIVPLKRITALKKATVSIDKYFNFIRSTWAKPIIVFCPQSHTGKNDISVRMFAQCYDIPEDPATGSGNGCLAAYFIKNRYWGNDEIDIRAEQGYEINRASLLYLRAKVINGAIEVFVGGKSVKVAEGTMQI